MSAAAAVLSSVFAVAEAGTLAVTWSDCGAKHATVTDLQPTSITTGTTVTLTGSGPLDEEVTSAHFKTTVSAKGVQLTSCEGDATTDIVCKLPLGTGSMVVKAVSYPLPAGTVNIPVDVTTSSLIPASLAAVDVHISATEQNGDDVICLDVHTKKEEELETTGGTLAVTWSDCGAQHGKVTDIQPLTIAVGSTSRLVGTAQNDEEVTSGQVKATVSAKGVKLVSCEGDGTSDITCKLPLNTGKIVVPALAFPLAAGEISIPMDVTTSSVIPASLAAVDVHIAATEQNGEDVLCVDVHTEKQEALQVTGGTLGVTWSDCGAQHGKVTDIQPLTIAVGSTSRLVGTAQNDEEVTSGQVKATVSAKGVKLVSCEGDGTSDITCKLPLNTGKIVVPALSFPLAAGEISIPMDVTTSSVIPASLAAVDVHITATEQNGEDVLCVDVHTEKQSVIV